MIQVQFNLFQTLFPGMIQAQFNLFQTLFPGMIQAQQFNNIYLSVILLQTIELFLYPTDYAEILMYIQCTNKNVINTKNKKLLALRKFLTKVLEIVKHPPD